MKVWESWEDSICFMQNQCNYSNHAMYIQLDNPIVFPLWGGGLVCNYCMSSPVFECFCYIIIIALQVH